MRFKWFVMPAVAAGLAGCVTPSSESHVEVSFDSEPAAAEVRIPSGRTCLTPCRLFVERGPAVPLVFSKPGYVGVTVAPNLLPRGGIEPVTVTLVPEGPLPPGQRRGPPPSPAAVAPSAEDVEAARELLEAPPPSIERQPTPAEVLAR